MFNHAYGAYKKYAHPADELMPLSCRGRYRGSEKNRGDIDEALGNFSLTLVDTLDTLVVLGQIEEFETQVHYVIDNVKFDADAIVSVFETNIRVLGGLLGAHSMAVTLKNDGKGMFWYDKELLEKATILADKLLLAFNTSTGIPYPKINLKYGIHHPESRVGHETHTCTACAGTMIMEFAALSRLTGNPIYEEKAHKAMEALWKFRSHHSDLVGTTINIHSGDWTRRDSGVGAGIDSYYEYCLKAYILLGDETYRDKFNKHYAAIKKYIRQGYMMLDVYMHQPDVPARSFIDALQAFWPGLQVLKGDLQPAIETHEILYNVAKKYKFLPEAFTTSLDLYWAQHPLRPEFIESTYFLHQATKDPYYLEVGKHVIDTLEEHARVKCGYAAFKDLRTFAHEDKMDSFVLAETFKYLYLLFSEESEHVIDVHNFIFTTEAHLLPLHISLTPAPTNTTSNTTKNAPKNKAFEGKKNLNLTVELDDHSISCPNTKYLSNLNNFAEVIRKNMNSGVSGYATKKNPFCSKNGIDKEYAKINAESFIKKIKFETVLRKRKITVKEFNVNDATHIGLLRDMGIKIQKESNGKIQLQHQSNEAKTTEDAKEGILFMQEMIEYAKETGITDELSKPRHVKIVTTPHNNLMFSGGYAQFGPDLDQQAIQGELVQAEPFNSCQNIANAGDLINRIVVLQRGGCMFIDKARLVEKLGAIGAIIVDHNKGTTFATAAPFGMSGDDNPSNVGIPAIFLFNKEGEELVQLMNKVRRNSKHLVAILHGKTPPKVPKQDKNGH
ncbi:ER degradation-enhancing alpha-mannosidase-like protein 3 isoform X2 [Clytia hemisphaerica]|uniref:ER degradation-enhancing alpha-mannosidase-like protein 3 isoform X2 n=1 Tax=Clytia hemisphaerica TaxID=252671 RepID=UPI0034D751DF